MQILNRRLRSRANRQRIAKYKTLGSYEYMRLGVRKGHEFADERSWMAVLRGSEKIKYCTYPQREPFRNKQAGRARRHRFALWFRGG